MPVPPAETPGDQSGYLLELAIDPKRSFLGSSAAVFLGAAAAPPESVSRIISESLDSSPLLKRTKSQSGNGGSLFGKLGTPSRERHPSRSHGPPPAASAAHSRQSRPASTARAQTHDLSDSPHASPAFGVLCSHAF